MIDKLIKEIEQNYRDVPYHNIWLLSKSGLKADSTGGICTDRNYFLFKELLSKGYNVSLHSANINKQPIHQLIRVLIDNSNYLIDVGLGWPIMEPIPLFKEIELEAYGVRYLTKIRNEELSLYRVIGDTQILNYTTSVYDCDQKVVMAEILNSYSETINYPFRDSIRFSQVAGDIFYFLRGDTLYYSSDGVLNEKKISSVEHKMRLFQEVFSFDFSIVEPYI